MEGYVRTSDLANLQREFKKRMGHLEIKMEENMERIVKVI